MPDFDFSDVAKPLGRTPRVRSGFNAPRDGGRRIHRALDWDFAEGDPVAVNRPGRVQRIGENPRAGRHIFIDHGDGHVSSYSHLSGIDVREGDEILPGQPFARAGSTGTSTGPHVHQVVSRGGQRINPQEAGILPVYPYAPKPRVPAVDFADVAKPAGRHDLSQISAPSEPPPPPAVPPQTAPLVRPNLPPEVEGAPEQFPALDRPGFSDALSEVIRARGVRSTDELRDYARWVTQASEYGDLSDPAFRSQVVGGSIRVPGPERPEAPRPSASRQPTRQAPPQTVRQGSVFDIPVREAEGAGQSLAEGVARRAVERAGYADVADDYVARMRAEGRPPVLHSTTGQPFTDDEIRARGAVFPMHLSPDTVSRLEELRRSRRTLSMVPGPTVGTLLGQDRTNLNPFFDPQVSPGMDAQRIAADVAAGRVEPDTVDPRRLREDVRAHVTANLRQLQQMGAPNAPGEAEFDSVVEMVTNQQVTDLLEKRRVAEELEGGRSLGLSDVAREVGRNPTKLLPFLSSIGDLINLDYVGDAARREREGKATEEDRIVLRHARAVAGADRTLLNRIGSVVAELPSFAGELALTGGAYQIPKEAAERGLRKAVGDRALGKAGEFGVRAAGSTAGAAAQTVPAGALRIVAGTVERVQRGEDEATALVKAVGEQFIETWSERTGGALDMIPGVRRVSKAAQRVTKPLKQFGYHGVAGEMFEERVGEFARWAVGLQPELTVLGVPVTEYATAHGWREAGKQLLVETVGFGVPGVAATAADRLTAPVPEPPETLRAQFRSASDPQSPRAAVLLTPGEEVRAPRGFASFDLPEGRLYLNREKAKALGLTTTRAVREFAAAQGFEPLIGKVAPVADTSQGVALRTEDAGGTELSTSVVPDAASAVEQAVVDRAQFPEAANQELMPAQEAAARREDETLSEQEAEQRGGAETETTSPLPPQSGGLETAPPVQPRIEAVGSPAQTPSAGEGIAAPISPPALIVQHSNPDINGDKVIGKTADGRLKVQGDDGITHTVQNPRTQGNREAALVKEVKDVPTVEGGAAAEIPTADGGGIGATGSVQISTEVPAQSVAAEHGLAPAPIATPETGGGEKERSLPQTLIGAGLEGGRDLSYDPISNDDALAAAQRTVEELGVDAAVELAKRSESSAESTALGISLVRRLQDEGKYEQAVELASDLSRRLTREGQAIQAVSIVSRLAPERVVMAAQRIVEKRTPRARLKPEHAEKVSTLARRLEDAQARISTLEQRIEEARLTQSSVRAHSPKIESLNNRLTRLEAEARERLKARAAGPGAAGPQAGATTILPDLADYAIIGAVKLARKGVTFASWSEEMVLEFGEAIKPQLRQIYRQSFGRLRDERKAMREATDERLATAGREGLGAEEVAELVEQRRQAMRDARAARADLARTFNRLERGRLGQIADRVVDVANVPRTLMSSVDLSAPLRQGGFFTLTEPRQSAQAARDMIRAISERGYDTVLEELAAHADYKLAKRMGVEFTEVGRDDLTNLSQREEAFLSSTAGRLPVVKHSQQAYTAFLDSQRMQVFSKFARELRERGFMPEKDEAAFRYIAKFINAGTGRGNLGEKGKQWTPALNIMLFSPRYLASRLQLLNMMMNPISWARMPSGARRIVMRKNMQFASTVGLALGLAIAAGATVNLDDPEDPDWLKIKIGNSRYDLLAGLQQPARFMYRLGNAIRADLQEDETYTDKPKGEIAEDFWRSKQAPGFSFLFDYLKGETYKGEEFQLGAAVKERLIPLFLKDVIQAASEEGLAGAVKTIPAFFGVGVQTYEANPDRPTTKAEKLAAKLMRERMPDKPRAAGEREVSQSIARLKHAGRQGQDIEPQLAELQKSGAITPRQVDNIRGAARLTPLQEDVKALPKDEAERVFRLASPEEKLSLVEIIKEKRLREAERKAKEEEDARNPDRAKVRQRRAEKADRQGDKRRARRYRDRVDFSDLGTP
jgi:hypothetical protein